MRSLRRVAAGALTLLVVAGSLLVLTESPAQAAKVGNPGSGFTLRVQQGLLRIKTNNFDFNDETRLPQCSDGANNDDAQDSAVDFPADGQCASAADDSEVAGGVQPKLPIQMTNGTVNTNGTYSFPAANVTFPRQYMWVADAPVVGSFQVNIDIVALTPATGTINANTGQMSLDLTVEVRASGGQINSGCKVGPISVSSMITGTTAPPGPNTPITGVPYNPATGRVTLVNNSYSVPSASGCTATFLSVDVNGQINDQLGLPSAAGNNEGMFLGEFLGTRPQAAITATFTATPSSGGVDPQLVSFNAAGSTGAGIGYQWDFTNNGSFDATGLTTTNTYAAGTHTARLRVTDSGGDFVETTRTIVVNPNLPPTANDQTVSTPEDTPKGITLTGSDPEGASLAYTRVAPNPTNGSVSCTGTACTYTPNANFNGSDTFGFRVTDNLGNFDNAVVTVNVTPTNDTPTASNVSATIIEDTPGTVTFSGADIDGDTLTYVIVTPPTKGALSGTGGSRTYTPNANQNGADSFTYHAQDPSGALSNVATASITITATNDAPTADPQSLSTAEDTAIPVTLTGSDIDSTFVFGIVTPPAHGSLSGSLPNLTYTPAANYHGTDSFTFKVTDPSGAVGTADIDLTVTPVNDAPTTANVSTGTNEGTPVDVTIPGNDLDGDTLSFTPTDGADGTVTCAGAVCTYTPDSGFAGVDTFTVDVSDGTVTVTSTVTVNVSALNNTNPVINDQTAVVLEDTTRTFALVSGDADGDPLTHTVLVPPASGSLSCTAGGSCTFAPGANANGNVTATVQVSDGRGGADTAVVTLAIIPVNDLPTVPAQSVTTNEDAAVSVDLAASDVDGNTVTWSVKAAPAKGSLSCTGAGACTYTPNANANGSDSFDVEADDGHGGRVRITVPVTITGVNDPPTAGTVARSVAEDGSLSFALIGGDAADGGPVTFAAGAGSLGTLACSSGGACSYTTNPNANGVDTIAYSVSDGTATATGSIVLTIIAGNDAPTATDATLSTPEDTARTVTLGGTDPDPGDTLTFTVTSVPASGTLSGTAPNLTFTPAANSTSTVAIGFRVTDLAGLQDTGTVTITVTPVDDAPVANSGAKVTAEDTAVAIALTGSDVEGPVTVAVTTAPAHGTYASGIYTPALHYNGADTIGFSVTDNGAQVTNGVILITVTPVNDPPVANDLALTTTRTVSVAATLPVSDPDGVGTLTYTILTAPTKGTLSGTAPNLTYKPTGFNTGNDVFTYKVTDSSGVTDSGTVTITIGAGSALATQLAVSPATVVRPTGLAALLGAGNTYNNLKATLTTVGSNLPVAGRPVAFTVNGAAICTATTNASGVATCSGTGPNVAATSYQASHAANASFAASTGTGGIS